jgi:hypothetical protein
MSNQGGLFVVNTHSIQLPDLINFYSNVDKFSIFIETPKFKNIKVNPIYLGLSAHGRTDAIIIDHPNGEQTGWNNESGIMEPIFDLPPNQLRSEDVFEALKPLFFSDKLKIGYNIKLDIKNLSSFYNQKVISKPYFDLMLASFFYNNSLRNNPSLLDCAKEHMYIDKFPELTSTFDKTSYSGITQYIGFRTETIFKLYHYFFPYLENNLQNLWSLQTNILEQLIQGENKQ